jgi:crotonobetainyl-CoA:carnitine CoA-transferase CaiB-like acyl-CoA transferase
LLGPKALLRDPHLEVMGLFPVLDHPTEGQIRLIAPPVRSSTEAARLGRLPPSLGQHSREILGSLGLPDGVIGALLASGGVVG